MLNYPQMLRLFCLAAALCCCATVRAADLDRDFTGKWFLDPRASNLQSISGRPNEVLVITLSDGKIKYSAATDDGLLLLGLYALDGSEVSYRSGAESRNSRVKWEGDALLTNTLVSGPSNYVIMDRWQLSRDHALLTIGRQVQVGAAVSEGRLVYRREGHAMTAPAAAPALVPRPAPARTAPPASPAASYTVPSGTRILLTLVNSLNTKHSREGDRVYLQTAFPVSASDRIVIPRGASVTGTVTDSKRPGRVAGKGELYIRFDSLTLSNGVTRDFRARLSNADTRKGTVDRDEGKVTGAGNRGGDAKTVARDAGMGASVGGIAGAASGNAGKGLGIGGAAGAAAGLATVLIRRGPDVVLPKGTKVEMVLDRDLVYSDEELRR